MGSLVTFSFDAFDVYNNTKYYADHRGYVRHRFADLGYEVTLWGWDKSPTTGEWTKYDDGIKFKKNDSDINLSIEVTGEVGKNLRPLGRDAAGE